MSSVTRARESLTVALERGIKGRVIKSPATPPVEVSTTPGSGGAKRRKSEISSKTSNDAKKSNRVVVVNGNETGETINDIDSMKKINDAMREINEAIKKDNVSAATSSFGGLKRRRLPREVGVQCATSYEDLEWMNIGKDPANVDAVNYSRALRPPYHLQSFLRIKGFSAKGESSTEHNTLVFVVVEGEVTVTIHTTEFVASKGDSFFVPPRNSYNLVNHAARDAELSLLQFHYDGPLTTKEQNQ